MVTVLFGLIEDAQRRIDAIQRRVDAVELDDLMIADGSDVVQSWESKGIKEKRNYLRRMIHQIDALLGRGPIDERVRITPVG